VENTQLLIERNLGDCDLGPDGKPVIDPHGLWDHVCRLFRKDTPAADMAVQDRISLIQYLQKRYNGHLLNTEVSKGRECRWRPAKQEVESATDKSQLWYRCNSPLCPRCWWRIQTKCLTAIKATQYPVLYFRETSRFACDDFLPARLWTKFNTRQSSYKPVAWTVAFDSDESQGDRAEYGGRSPSNILNQVYPVVARFIGVFGAMRPVKQFDVAYTARDGDDVCTWSDVDDPVHGIHSVSRYELSATEEACRHWLDKIGHPTLVDTHSSFEEAITWSKAYLGHSFGTSEMKSKESK
jgi:hypothetical protein